jgi:hypothetical protein
MKILNTNIMNWNWIVVTDDPTTLPPVDEPVFISDGKHIRIGQCGIKYYRDLHEDKHYWAGAYQAPFCDYDGWYGDGAEDISFTVRAWHPFPPLDTVSFLLDKN